MNEEVMSKANEVLIRMIEGVDGAIDLTQQEVPIVIEQLLLWRIYESVFYLLLSVVCAVFVAGSAWIINKKSLLDELGSLVLGLLVPVLFSVALFLEHFPVLIKVLIAPKLYLLEYSASLIK